MENNTDFQFALLSLCFKNLSSSKKKLLINSQKEDEKNTLKSEPVFLGARDERNLVSLRSGFPFFSRISLISLGPRFLARVARGFLDFA